MGVFFLDKNLWQIDLFCKSIKKGLKVFEGGVVFKWKMTANFLRQTSLIDGVFKGLPLWMACKTPMDRIESPTIAQCMCMLPRYQKPRKAAQMPDFGPCCSFAGQSACMHHNDKKPSKPSDKKTQNQSSEVSAN